MEHPLPAWRSAISTGASILQYAFLAAFFLGAERLCSYLGIPEGEPHPLKTILDNKMYGIACYFGCSMLSSYLTSTGAYEIYVNGDTLLYSGLANSGSVPSPEYLARLLVEKAGLKLDPSYEHLLQGAS